MKPLFDGINISIEQLREIFKDWKISGVLVPNDKRKIK